VDVVVPLVTASGTALLVDRGWVATTNQGLTDPSQVPAPPSGTVTITGSVRRNADGGSAQVVDGSARAISSTRIQPAIGIPVYGGFVDLTSETPAPATPLEPAGLPDLSNGPHFFYALQWWFFGLLALFGFGYLAWEEATGRAERRRVEQPAGKQARTNLVGRSGTTRSEG
jgi:cytochrome oxidase assembly protein ShyY1